MLLNIIFFPVWFSILNTEVSKLIVILRYKGWEWRKKICAAMSGSLIHGFLFHQQKHIDMRKQELLQLSTGGADEKLMDLQRKDEENTRLQSLLRSVENSMEHLPQLVIALNLLAKISYSPNLGEYYLKLLGGDLNFIVFSAIVSASSLIVGQVRTGQSLETDFKHIYFCLS